MKKLSLIVLALMSFSFAGFAQDRDTTTTKFFFRDTLTATIDTIQISMLGDQLGAEYWSVVMYRTSAGYDTVKVDFLSGDGLVWVKEALTDAVSGLDSTQFISTEVPREVFFQQPPIKTRFITADGVASTVFIMSARKSWGK